MWWLIAGLLACTCDAEVGVVRVCTPDDFSGAGGMVEGVTVTADDGVAPFEARTGADGCVDLELTPGTWTISVWDEGAQCTSEDDETVSVRACGEEELTMPLSVCVG